MGVGREDRTELLSPKARPPAPPCLLPLCFAAAPSSHAPPRRSALLIRKRCPSVCPCVSAQALADMLEALLGASLELYGLPGAWCLARRLGVVPDTGPEELLGGYCALVTQGARFLVPLRAASRRHPHATCSLRAVHLSCRRHTEAPPEATAFSC